MVNNSIKKKNRSRCFFSKAWIVAILLLGTGQILPFGWYYPMGVSFGDILFLILLALEIIFYDRKNELWQIFTLAKFELMAVGLIVVALIFSVAINYKEYIIFRPEYILWIFRLIYFAIMITAVAYVVAHRLPVEVAVKCYLIGLITAIVLNFLNDFAWSVPNERCGLFIWSNPNVIGNIACIGLIFSSLWLREGGRPYVGYIVSFLLLGLAALLSFSKASWVMLILAGILTLIFALQRPSYSAKQMRNVGVYAIAIFFSALIILQVEKLICYVDLKLMSSPPSLVTRRDFALSAKDILLKHPFGVGVGRYYEYSTGFPVLNADAVQTGFSAAGNPHSAILYLAICGGWGALLGFVALICRATCAFVTAVRRSSSKVTNVLIGVLFSGVLSVSASFQLQILTVNFLYVIMGIIVAINLKSYQKEVDSRV
jgi:O-antigen ligase